MIDRGFIKWQPFNSVVSAKELIPNHKVIQKPTFFPEKINDLENIIINAYYAQELITITFYENNKLITLNSTITKLNPNNHTINLNNYHPITFNQIININH